MAPALRADLADLAPADACPRAGRRQGRELADWLAFADRTLTVRRLHGQARGVRRTRNRRLTSQPTGEGSGDPAHSPAFSDACATQWRLDQTLIDSFNSAPDIWDPDEPKVPGSWYHRAELIPLGQLRGCPAWCRPHLAARGRAGVNRGRWVANRCWGWSIRSVPSCKKG